VRECGFVCVGARTCLWDQCLCVCYMREAGQLGRRVCLNSMVRVKLFVCVRESHVGGPRGKTSQTGL